MKRTILITGGTGKFGQSLVKHFLESGDRVVTNSRNSKMVSRLRREFEGYGDSFVILQSDLTNIEAIPSFVQALKNSGIQPDYLINNARNIDYLQIEKDGSISRGNFLGEFLLDVIVPYELTMELANQDESKLSGIVNISSQYGNVAANPNLYDDPSKQSPLHYGVCKAALNHLTKELAVRLAGKEIRVNGIAFGGVEGRVDKDFKKRYSKLCPMGRMLLDNEVCGPIDILCSDIFSGMTGQTINVDGGWSIW